jgi:hypothetical protein
MRERRRQPAVSLRRIVGLSSLGRPEKVGPRVVVENIPDGPKRPELLANAPRPVASL